MVNPFQEFRSYSMPRREIPLDRILVQRDNVLKNLLASYQALVDEESKQLVWVVERGALARAYETAAKALQGVAFTLEDLEDVCLELDSNDGVSSSLGAPSGLFIAAMCNHVAADDINLNLHTLSRRLPFLGYRLPRGRRLCLEGDAGDFVGALLEGGEVLVSGNVGNYAGIGMIDGVLDVTHSTGKYTGEGMLGGTMRVHGRIGCLGRVKHGVIYEGNQQIFPPRKPEQEPSRPLTKTKRA